MIEVNGVPTLQREEERPPPSALAGCHGLCPWILRPGGEDCLAAFAVDADARLQATVTDLRTVAVCRI